MKLTLLALAISGGKAATTPYPTPYHFTAYPTPKPTSFPTPYYFTAYPTPFPSPYPTPFHITAYPSSYPTSNPTQNPTLAPTKVPTPAPTVGPTKSDPNMCIIHASNGCKATDTDDWEDKSIPADWHIQQLPGVSSKSACRTELRKWSTRCPHHLTAYYNRQQIYQIDNERYTSSCSHLHCETNFGDHGLITVNHYRQESFGLKHVCKHQLHERDKVTDLNKHSRFLDLTHLCLWYELVITVRLRLLQ